MDALLHKKEKIKIIIIRYNSFAHAKHDTFNMHYSRGHIVKYRPWQMTVQYNINIADFTKTVQFHITVVIE